MKQGLKERREQTHISTNRGFNPSAEFDSFSGQCALNQIVFLVDIVVPTIKHAQPFQPERSFEKHAVDS